MPARVIDAPIPADLTEDWYRHQIAIVNRKNAELESRIARLEAEKQEAHTEGWNAAIEEASGAAGQFWDEDDALQIDRITAAIHGLSKPTAAKQGDPS